jgi:hypothetical protein
LQAVRVSLKRIHKKDARKENIAVFKIKAYIHKSETNPHSQFELPLEVPIAEYFSAGNTHPQNGISFFAKLLDKRSFFSLRCASLFSQGNPRSPTLVLSSKPNHSFSL